MGDLAAALANPNTFKIDGGLLKDLQDALLVLHANDSAVAAAIAADKPFPAGKLELGSMRLAASTGNAVSFAGVTFNATADGSFHLGVYTDAADALKDLSPNPEVSAGIALNQTAGSRYLMLRCGYDAAATAKGAMALGAGASINFGGAASSNAAYAVIHQFSDGEGARSAVEQTIAGWRLPNQIDPASFPARTWLVAEVDGSVALNIGVQAGYDYSWLRQFPGGALKGDLGLKVELAANAALGFSASGSFALALSRATDASAIRLRLSKLANNGWNFAFNARAGAQATLPANFQQGTKIDDLLSAVFGVHIAQLVNDLTDPGITSSSSVANFLTLLGKKQLPGVQDAQTLFAAGQAASSEFLNEWQNLPHSAATMLTSILQRNEASNLTPFLEQMGSLSATDQKGVQDLLAGALNSADFFQAPVGRWIESVAPATSLATIVGTADWSVVKKLSDAALGLIQNQALPSLIDYAGKNLALDRIAQAIQQNNPGSLDAWLQSKIAAFLGSDPAAQLTLADLQKAQTVLDALKKNADKFFNLAKQAAQKKYEFDFVAAYQESSSSAALLDATFDLTAAAALRNAIDGDFQDLLLQKIPGVTLAAATLTHGINRQSHSDLTLPFVDLSNSDAASALASVSPVEDNGRVLLYNLNAQDEAKTHKGFFRASSESDSKLAFVASLPVSVSSGVRNFKTSSVSYGYTLTKASTALGSAQLLDDLQPLVDAYMPGLFGAGKPELADWVKIVDGQLDPANPGVLGHGLFSFDVALPPGALNAWFATSQNGKDPQYFAMSKAVQRFLRRIIPFYYFADPARYDAGPLSDNLLAYQALPPANGFKFTGDGHMGAPTSDVYFGVDAENLTALMETPDFANALRAAMEKGRSVLSPIGQAASALYASTDDNVQRIVQHALQAAQLPGILASLLFFENGLIGSIVDTGVAMARFRAAAATEPAAALKQLAVFGETFAETFNGHLGGNILAGSYLRPLGSALMLEAAGGLAGNSGDAAQATALFRLTVVDTPAPSLDDLLAGNFGQTKILLRETLASRVRA